jgi:hypothetical protein
VCLPCDVHPSPPPIPSQGGGARVRWHPHPPLIGCQAHRRAWRKLLRLLVLRRLRLNNAQRLQSLSYPSPPLPTRGGTSLAEHQAATVLQCWKRHIWLSRWFNQQALLKQKHLRLQTLFRGASTYASLVRGNRSPPPAPTKKSSDPKVLNHPFRPGRRAWPCAPDSGGGPSCMPLVFWAIQTLAASDLLGVRECGSTITPYVSPTTAATTIQKAYRY